MRFSRSTLIVILLIATLGMTATLAYEAYQSARSHRQTAENVLRDYASFAAWELSRTGRQQLLNVISSELHEVQQSVSSGRLSGVVAATHHCGTCGGVHRMRSAFYTPLPDVQLSFAGEPIDPAIVNVLTASIAEGMKKPDEFTCPTLRPMWINGSTAIVVSRPIFDRGDKVIGVAGFVSDPEFVAAIFGKLLKSTSLLPPSLGAANPNDMLVVRVSDADGRQLFASAGEWSKYVGADKVLGFRLGADDYVTKPFGLLELLARIEALLRRTRQRSPAGAAQPVERFADIEVDPSTRSVRRQGQDVALTPMEFDLLVALIRRRGAVASRLELLKEVWGHSSAVMTRTVDTHIGELRRKLEADASSPRHILTVRKAGYRLAREG